MSMHHHYSLSDLDNMIPYELDLYINLITAGNENKGKKFTVDDTMF